MSPQELRRSGLPTGRPRILPAPKKSQSDQEWYENENRLNYASHSGTDRMHDDLENCAGRCQDTYMISAANDTCGNCTPPEIRASEQASAYCERQGRTMVAK